MPGAVSRTSSIALTNATLSRGLCIADNGLEGAAKSDRGIKSGINCYNGTLTCREVAETFGLDYADFKPL
jgi:alanine dehydrogenase